MEENLTWLIDLCEKDDMIEIIKICRNCFTDKIVNKSLQKACVKGSFKVVKWLYKEFKSKIDDKILIEKLIITAFDHGNLEIIKYFCKKFNWLNMIYNINLKYSFICNERRIVNNKYNEIYYWIMDEFYNMQLKENIKRAIHK